MSKQTIWMGGLALLTTLTVGTASLTSAQATSEALSGFAAITPDTLHDLQLGYAVPGNCLHLDSTGKLIITDAGIYEIASGKALFNSEGIIDDLSADGTAVSVFTDGIYDLASGEKRFAISNFPVFSPDGSLVAVATQGVYETASGKKLYFLSGLGFFSPDGSLVADLRGVYAAATGQKRLSFTVEQGTGVDFSADGMHFAIENDGVYDTANGQKLFSITGSPVFSPDGALVATRSGGVYEVASGAKRFAIAGSPHFSDDGALLGVDGDGIYDVASGAKRFAISDVPFFSPDGSLVAVEDDGVYDAVSGEKRFAIAHIPVFNPDGSLLAVWNDGIYDVAQGQKMFDMPYKSFIQGFTENLIYFSLNAGAPEPYCVLVGLKGDPWPMSQTFVVTAGSSDLVRVYDAPSLDAHSHVIEPGILLVVQEQSSDGQWERVSDDRWIQTVDVQVVHSAGLS